VTAEDNRLFVNAVLWIGKTGAPWRDLPERFGLWNSAWKRFDRRAAKGPGCGSSRRCRTPTWDG
jgi:transposase